MVRDQKKGTLFGSSSIQKFPVEEFQGLVFGREVNICYSQTRLPSEHQHEQAQFLLTFENALVEVGWREGSALHKKVLGPYQFCLIPPEVRHTCRWAEGAELVLLFLEKNAFLGCAKRAGPEILFGDFKALCQIDELLFPLAEELRKQGRQIGAANSALSLSISLALVGRTIEDHFKEAETGALPGNCLPPSAVRKISAYVEAHLKDSLSGRILAAQVGLSAAHFVRLFKCSTGTTPTQFIARSRVQKALDLLRTGEYRVADAACEVGFYDQSHLDRHCKKFFGHPPKLVLKSALKAS